MKDPCLPNWEAIIWIVRYLIAHLGHGLLYKANSYLLAEAFIDANWTGSSSDRKSTNGSFFDTQYSFHLSKLKLKLRSGIMTVIYQKCLHINLAERSKFSEGEIQTFMSIDADRTVNLCNSFHDFWR